MPNPDLPISRGGAKGGEGSWVLGHAGQAVPVPVKTAKEGLGEHPFQLDRVQSSLIFTFSLKRVLRWAREVSSKRTFWQIEQ